MKWFDFTLRKHCIQCGELFRANDMVFYIDNDYGRFICKRCSTINSITEKFRRLAMSNIKITAEVDGKIVPLNTISDETFRAIKAAARTEEIPIISIGNFPGDLNDRRLFLKINSSIREAIERNVVMIAIDLMRGQVVKSWTTMEHGLGWSDGVRYENIQSL